MRTAPVGLFFEPELAYHMGCDVSAITHGHQAGITAGGAMSMLVSFLRRGKRIDDAVDETIDFLESARAKRSDGDRDAAETVAALKHAKYATSANELGQGWGAEEALAIGVHCALKHSDDSRSGVLEAVNIDGDSDSTGAITGNLLGVAKGVAGIPEEWVTNLRERRIVETVAWDLLAEIETDEDDYVFESWWNKYPGYRSWTAILQHAINQYIAKPVAMICSCTICEPASKFTTCSRKNNLAKPNNNAVGIKLF